MCIRLWRLRDCFAAAAYRPQGSRVKTRRPVKKYFHLELSQTGFQMWNLGDTVAQGQKHHSRWLRSKRHWSWLNSGSSVWKRRVDGWRKKNSKGTQFPRRSTSCGGVALWAGPRRAKPEETRLHCRSSASLHTHTYAQTHTPTHTYPHAPLKAQL